MDKQPPTPPTTFQKLADFLFGCLLVGGAPVAVSWLLMLIASLAFDYAHKHHGESAVRELQTIVFPFIPVSALTSFIFAILWRIIHRRTPRTLVALEVVLAMFGAVLFLGYWGILIGPNDSWND